jgi:hypothetical protein
VSPLDKLKIGAVNLRRNGNAVQPMIQNAIPRAVEDADGEPQFRVALNDRWRLVLKGHQVFGRRAEALRP